MLVHLDEVQSKPIVCVQLFFWNILDLLRCTLTDYNN